MNFNDVCRQIHDEMAQQIWIAGYHLNCEDTGWAFDRAIFALELNTFVDQWSDADFDREADMWDRYKIEVSK